MDNKIKTSSKQRYLVMSNNNNITIEKRFKKKL